MTISPFLIRRWPWLLALALLLLFLVMVRGILLPFVIGMLVAYFLDPAADKLETFRSFAHTGDVLADNGFGIFSLPRAARLAAAAGAV